MDGVGRRGWLPALVVCVAGLVGQLGLVVAQAAETGAGEGYVALQREAFRTVIDGRAVDLYTLRNSRGMQVSLTNYGARIEQILVPDRNGRLGDVALGYAGIRQVLAGQPSMGAFIGRYANRIAGAGFELDGVSHHLSGASHGGLKGSRFRVFDARQLGPAAVEMTLLFADGEEGFPGTLPLRVVYRVTEADELVIEYQAVAVDRATVFNFTNHAFFNLSGVAGSSILDHELELAADEVLEVDAQLVPSGARRAVAGTPMDFRSLRPVGRDIGADDDLLRFAHGYDHYFVLRHAEQGGLRFNARLHDPRSGRILEVWSTEPGIQVFSANSLNAEVPRDVGKEGVAYPARSAICLEPSHFPDSPHHPEFPSTVLRKGQWYAGSIVYRFSTDQRDAEHP